MTNNHMNHDILVSNRLDEESTLDMEKERKLIHLSFNNIMDSPSSPPSMKNNNKDENTGLTVPALVALDYPASTDPSTPSTPSSPCKEHHPYMNPCNPDLINNDAVSDPKVPFLDMSTPLTNENNMTGTTTYDTIDHARAKSTKDDKSEEKEVTVKVANVEKEGSNDYKVGSHGDDDSVVMGPIVFFRKSIVAITGAAMLGVGAVLVPAPVPLGLPVIIGAVALLNAEFPETVNGVKEDARKKLVQVLEKDDNINAEEDQTNPETLSHTKNDDNGDDNINSTQKVPEKNIFQASIDKKTQKFKQNLRTKVLPWLKKGDETANTKK